MDAIRFGTGRIVNFGMMARNEIATRAEVIIIYLNKSILNIEYLKLIFLLIIINMQSFSLALSLH